MHFDKLNVVLLRNDGFGGYTGKRNPNVIVKRCDLSCRGIDVGRDVFPNRKTRRPFRMSKFKDKKLKTKIYEIFILKRYLSSINNKTEKL